MPVAGAPVVAQPCIRLLAVGFGDLDQTVEFGGGMIHLGENTFTESVLTFAGVFEAGSLRS